MKILKLIMALALLCLSVSLSAQRNTIKLDGKVTCMVIDAASKSPLSYATVSIFDMADSLVTGDVSDVEGKVHINVPYGTFYVMIETISFETYKSDLFILNDQSPSLDLGQVDLTMASTLLNEIEVVAEKSEFQYSLDKKKFNVGKDIASSGGSIIDVLDQVPSVSVDPAGRIALRGSQSVKILIDGKPSAMTSVKMLQNLQSNMVDRVEVVTNPSAKYESEGLAGIINIVLKKDKKLGITGSYNLSASLPQDYGIGLRVQRRKERFNIFANIGLRYYNRPKSDKNRTIYNFANVDYEITNTKTTKRRRNISGDFQLGLDYYIGENSILTGSVFYERARQPHDGEVLYSDFDEKGTVISELSRVSDELEMEQTLEYRIQYSQKFKRKGQKLDGFIQYADVGEDNQSMISMGEARQRTKLDEVDRNYVFQIDYTHPFKNDGKIEMGLRSKFRDIENNFLIEERNENDWSEMGNLSNDFLYSERVHAVYGAYEKESKGFSYKLGLRGELTELTTELRQTAQVNVRNPYFDLFPNVHLGYRFENDQSVQLSYSRRIQRPGFQDLNPFFSFTDARFISVGNPDLNPMYSHSMELGYLKTWDKSSFGSSIYQRYTNQLINEFITTDENDVTYFTSENFGQRNVTGIEIYGDAQISKAIKLNAGVDFIHSNAEGEIGSQKLNARYQNISGQLGTQLKFGKNNQVQMKYIFRGPREIFQGRIQSLSRFDMSYRRMMMEGKASLSISMMDLFYTYRIKYTRRTNDLMQEGISIPWRPTLRVAFRYRWQ